MMSKQILKRFNDRKNIIGTYKAFLTISFEALYRIFKFNSSIAYFFLSLKHKLILNYLDILNHKQISKEDIPTPKKKIDEKTIWIFWWQGETNMPDLVKGCLNSIRKHSGIYNVILITKNNVLEYLNIPILNKVGKEISYTNFSDYLRLSLLSIYGGGWIDATIFLTKDIPNEILNYKYYTIRHPEKKFICISNFRWGGSFIFSHLNNPLIIQVRNLFIKYWKYNDHLIDYFLIDYCFAYIFLHQKNCLELLEQVPYNNPKAYNGIENLLTEPYNPQLYDNITKETWIHKLSYKAPYKSDASQPTFYDFITQQ